MEKAIYYIGNNPEIFRFLKSSLNNQTELLKLEDLNQLQEVDYLLIVSPTKVALEGTFFRWVDVSSLWENYLLERFPHIQLMIVGFWSSNRINCRHYRDILELGNWQEDFLHSAFPSLEELYAEKKVQEGRLSEWDIKKYLKRFISGHNRQGLFKYSIALKHTMTLAYDEYESGNYPNIEQEVIKTLGEEEWKNLFERWTFYKPFLEHTPFCQHINKVESVFQEIHIYFKNVLKEFPDFTANEMLFAASPRKFETELEKIHKLLKYNLNPYI